MTYLGFALIGLAGGVAVTYGVVPWIMVAMAMIGTFIVTRPNA